MEARDVILLLHPIFAVIVVFPLLGMVVNRALLVRQRRLGADKAKIAPTVGQEHVQIGKLLTACIFVLVLLALANDVFGYIADNQIWSKDPFNVVLISLVFLAAIVALFLLHQAKSRLWRSIFATLSSLGLIVLGSQDGVYRKTEQWYLSHYYYGITAAILMIISFAILREIYQDKTQTWRKVHIILNSLALLLFIGQGITGAQSLLEVPLRWQEPYVQELYKQECQTKSCLIQPVIPGAKTP